MTYAQERMIFQSQRIYFPMRHAKKAVKYKVNSDAERSLQPVFSSFMETSMHWLNAVASISSIVGKAVMHST